MIKIKPQAIHTQHHNVIIKQKEASKITKSLYNMPFDFLMR